MQRFFLLVTACWLGGGVLGEAGATSPDRDLVTFSVISNVGFGNNIHVVGNHPDLGSWTPTNAIKLRWTTNNVWTGTVAVQKGTALEYKFMSRSFNSNEFCNPANAGWEQGANRTSAVPAAPPAPYTGKVLYYYTSWTNPSVIYRTGFDTNFFAVPMVNVAPGRTGGEFLFRAAGFGVAGAELQFVITDNLGSFDKSPFPTGVGVGGNDYLTPLDALVLQDGQIYNYWPAASVSAPRSETRNVGSSYAPPIDGRDIIILLPRGYDSHPWKRYPVMYFQDGQNLPNGANPGGTGAWDADLISQREISGGRMREVILVGVYNVPDRRRWEYNPPTDTYPAHPQGEGDDYLRFLVDNVRPTLDFNYRTLNDPRNTLVGGSSMGGIFSIYAGMETNVFGGVLAMSPAFTRAPNYKAALAGKTKRPMRIYMDTGNSEGKVGPESQPGGYYWDDPWDAYNSLLAIGYIPNLDLMMRVGCGFPLGQHTEVAWRTRLPGAFRFLLPVTDDPNRINQSEFPPEIDPWTQRDAVPVPTQRRIHYDIEISTNGATWIPSGTRWTETNAWDQRTLALTNTPAATTWLRVATTPAD